MAKESIRLSVVSKLRRLNSNEKPGKCKEIKGINNIDKKMDQMII